MKLVGNLFQDTPVSLEEGPAKCRSANKCLILHRDESKTNCGRFVQIVKVILCIELIILIGWLSCVAFSYYNTDRNTDCGVPGIGCKSLEIDYDGVEVKNSRRSRSVGDAEDGPEKCERKANAMQRRFDSFAAQFVTGESSNLTVVQLRRKFIKMMIRDYMRVIFAYALGQALGGLLSSVIPVKTVSNTNPFSTMSNVSWQRILEQLSEEFVNSTDSENRQWLEARGPPTGETMSEFRTIGESFINMHDCNMTYLSSLLSFRKFNGSYLQALLLWEEEPEPVKQLTIDCRDAEAQLLEERWQRLEAIAAEMASDYGSKSSTITLLNAIESALIARNPSEVTVEDDLLLVEGELIVWKRFVSNASLALKKEFYELVRDEFLELRNENRQSSSWEGYDLGKAYRNWTEGLQVLRERERPEAVLNITITLGKAFNLHYVEAEREDSSVDSEAPAFGTLTYLDAEPEKLGVRRLRHILNGFVRLYFRVINRLGPCQSAEESRLGTNVI